MPDKNSASERLRKQWLNLGEPRLRTKDAIPELAQQFLSTTTTHKGTQIQHVPQVADTANEVVRVALTMEKMGGVQLEEFRKKSLDPLAFLEDAPPHLSVDAIANWKLGLDEKIPDQKNIITAQNKALTDAGLAPDAAPTQEQIAAAKEYKQSLDEVTAQGAKGRHAVYKAELAKLKNDWDERLSQRLSSALAKSELPEDLAKAAAIEYQEFKAEFEAKQAEQVERERKALAKSATDPNANTPEKLQAIYGDKLNAKQLDIIRDQQLKELEKIHKEQRRKAEEEIFLKYAERYFDLQALRDNAAAAAYTAHLNRLAPAESTFTIGSKTPNITLKEGATFNTRADYAKSLINPNHQPSMKVVNGKLKQTLLCGRYSDEEFTQAIRDQILAVKGSKGENGEEIDSIELTATTRSYANRILDQPGERDVRRLADMWIEARLLGFAEDKIEGFSADEFPGTRERLAAAQQKAASQASNLGQPDNYHIFRALHYNNKNLPNHMSAVTDAEQKLATNPIPKNMDIATATSYAALQTCGALHSDIEKLERRFNQATTPPDQKSDLQAKAKSYLTTVKENLDKQKAACAKFNTIIQENLAAIEAKLTPLEEVRTELADLKKTVVGAPWPNPAVTTSQASIDTEITRLEGIVALDAANYRKFTAEKNQWTECQRNNNANTVDCENKLTQLDTLKTKLDITFEEAKKEKRSALRLGGGGDE